MDNIPTYNGNDYVSEIPLKDIYRLILCDIRKEYSTTDVKYLALTYALEAIDNE